MKNKRKLLLCPVDYFQVTYSINPWMSEKNPPVIRDKAKKQWLDLVSLYKDLGYTVSFIAPEKDLPDMVFAANGFFSIGNKAVIARYRYPQRQGETEHYKKWLEEHGFEVIDPKNICYEGQGDTLKVGDTIFQGWGFRSDREITGLMTKTFPEYTVVPLHLVDDRFYHLDTCFFPVNKDIVYYYDKAFSKDSQKHIQDSFTSPIAVTDEEAVSFALNSVATDHTIITNSQAKKFKERVQNDGFKVFSLDTGEFMKSGGSIKCLTNEID